MCCCVVGFLPAVWRLQETGLLLSRVLAAGLLWEVASATLLRGISAYWVGDGRDGLSVLPPLLVVV